MNFYNKIHRKESDEISIDFFDGNNMSCIHQQIIKQVKFETGVTISKQSDVELLHVMNNTYNLYGAVGVEDKRKRGKIIMDLNYKVIRECTDNIKSGILMYATYIKDASMLPVPLDRAQFTKSDKSMEMRSTQI